MKQLGIQVGAIVLAALVLAIVLGYVVSHVGGAGAVRILRDLSIIILALFYLIPTLIFAGIYFAGAWAIGRFGGKAVGGVHWVRVKTLWVEGHVERGTERFVIRPFARAVRGVTAAVVLVREFVGGPIRRRDLGHEWTQWRTRINRVRGRFIAPVSGYEPKARGQRDVQPGPGIAV